MHSLQFLIVSYMILPNRPYLQLCQYGKEYLMANITKFLMKLFSYVIPLARTDVSLCSRVSCDMCTCTQIVWSIRLTELIGYVLYAMAFLPVFVHIWDMYCMRVPNISDRGKIVECLAHFIATSDRLLFNRQSGSGLSQLK